MMVRFDAYTATGSGFRPADVVPMFQAVGGSKFTQGRGYHTFAERLSVKTDAGDEIGAISWGGRQGDRCMVEVKGEPTPALVEALRGRFEHRCTRVDSCVDIERPGAFDDVLGAVLRCKDDNRLYGERRGDWDYPELGRTQYLGAESSAVRARLYEKGKQPEYRHLGRFDLCRLEIQVRPAKDAKAHYAKLTAEEVWGASRWTRQLAAEVLQAHLQPHPPGSVWRHSEAERALRWMCKQYGSRLLAAAQDLGGFDVLGLTLGEIIKEQRSEP